METNETSSSTPITSPSTNITVMSAASEIRWGLHLIYVLVIIVIISISAWVWHDREATKTELAKYQTIADLQKVLSDTESKLIDAQNRAKNLYPQLEAKQAQYQVLLAQIEKKKASLKLITKESIGNDLQKTDIVGLSNLLNSAGYPNRVVGSESCK